MSTERFKVVLTGHTLRGLDVAVVAQELAKLIKRDIAFATRLLGGRPTKIRSDVDAEVGAQYLQALERIGVAAGLEPETLEIDAELDAAAPVHAGIASVAGTPIGAKPEPPPPLRLKTSLPVAYWETNAPPPPRESAPIERRVVSDVGSNWTRLASALKRISYVLGSLILAATIFISAQVSSQPDLQALAASQGWSLAAFFIGGAYLVSVYWDGSRGGVKTFSDFLHWLAGGFALGTFCSIALALILRFKGNAGSPDSEMIITMVIVGVIAVVPLSGLVAMSWVLRAFRGR